MGNPNAKGDQLEDVVEAIERFILNQNPGIKYLNLSIERKKKVTVDDVLHEIDLMVTLDLGNGYDAKFIFECKNWEANVNKNEIIVFSEKIQVTGASKGFFIAKGFTTFAEAQARKDRRVNLIIASEETDNFPYGHAANGVNQQNHHLDIMVFEFGSTESVTDIDFNAIPVVIDGAQVLLTHFLNNETSNITARKYSGATEVTVFPYVDLTPENFQVGSVLDVGSYKYQDHVVFTIDNPNSITFGNRAIRKIQVKVDHTIEIVAPTLTLHFDVHSRGRVGFYEYNLGGQIYKVQLTGKDGAPMFFADVKDVR